MCGRYYRRSDKQRIADAFRIGVPPSFDILPSFNVAPQTFQPVVRLDAETGERELALMRWGLIPFWARDAKIGYSTINAKAETVATSPAFREALRRRRCLVPADGFYEWRRLPGRSRLPAAGYPPSLCGVYAYLYPAKLDPIRVWQFFVSNYHLCFLPARRRKSPREENKGRFLSLLDSTALTRNIFIFARPSYDSNAVLSPEREVA